jgi:hypothetical protein
VSPIDDTATFFESRFRWRYRKMLTTMACPLHAEYNVANRRHHGFSRVSIQMALQEDADDDGIPTHAEYRVNNWAALNR